MTCSNWLRSALTSQRSRPCLRSSSIFSPTRRRVQHLQFGQHVAELQHLRPQRLPARKSQQLPHQSGGAIGVLLDLHDVLEGRIGRAVIGEQQVGIADDRGQHIVEIMRDAAGELADRLHLLRLCEFLLQVALLRSCRARKSTRRAGRLLLGRDRIAARSGSTRPAPRRWRSLSSMPLAAAAIALCKAARWGSARPWRQAASAFSGFQRAGEKFGKGGVGAQDGAVALDRGDGHGRGVEEAGETHFRGAQGFSAGSPPGARLRTRVREAPGAPSWPKRRDAAAAPAGAEPSRRLRSTSNCSVRTVAGRDRMPAPAARRRRRPRYRAGRGRRSRPGRDRNSSQSAKVAFI